MKTKIIFFIGLFLLGGCTTKLPNEQNAQLLKAYKQRNYFKLNQLMSEVKSVSGHPELMLYKATLDNAFNKPEEAIRLITHLLRNYPLHFNDTILCNLYAMRAQSDAHLQNYKRAFLDNKTILSKYAGVCDSAEIKSIKQDNSLYQYLVKAPKMTIIRDSSTRIPLKRDMAGLFNIPVNINGDTQNFIFDTGANISVIDKTLATKYGIKILGNKVRVGNPTGKVVEAEVGLLNIRLGNIEIKNAVFLIFPDSALTFAHGAYVIKGIIGFPIMYALKEFTVKNNQFLIIPKTPEKTSIRNFAFNGLTLDIMVQYQNDTLPFHFDSGADRTALYATFFKKYHDDIVKSCKKKTIGFAGVGSRIKIEAYLLDSARIKAGNAHGKLDSLYIQTKNLQGESSKYVYGNLGQDYIHQFSDMKINFVSMGISFSGKKN